MTIEELKHAIRAACNVSGDNEVWVFGSQAILGSFPDAPRRLLTSIEVDMQPRNKPETVDQVDGPLGEASMFHKTHGFYIHGFPISATKLPDGWESRVVEVVDDIGTGRFTGFCLEPHDLAASKLAAFRVKDRDYVRTLITEHMIEPALLVRRIQSLDIDNGDRSRLEMWVRETAELSNS